MRRKKTLRCLVGTNREIVGTDDSLVMIRLLDTPTVRNLERIAVEEPVMSWLDRKDFDVIYPTNADVLGVSVTLMPGGFSNILDA